MNSRRNLTIGVLSTVLLADSVLAVPAAEVPLIEPRVLVSDASIPPEQLRAQILAARRYDTFWSTGDESLARAALSANFTDRTLPPGRAQGIDGPIAASKTFRTAVPDLACAIEQMIVAGDRVVTHMRFTGHFTGTFNATKGKGQPVNFIATDIYRIERGQIAENWHIEDNLTLLTQFEMVKP